MPEENASVVQIDTTSAPVTNESRPWSQRGKWLLIGFLALMAIVAVFEVWLLMFHPGDI